MDGSDETWTLCGSRKSSRLGMLVFYKSAQPAHQVQLNVIHQLIILYQLELIRFSLSVSHKVQTLLWTPTTQQSFIRMHFSTIAWIVTALVAGQTLATPAKKAGT